MSIYITGLRGPSTQVAAPVLIPSKTWDCGLDMLLEPFNRISGAPGSSYTETQMHSYLPTFILSYEQTTTQSAFQGIYSSNKHVFSNIKYIGK